MSIASIPAKLRAEIGSRNTLRDEEYEEDDQEETPFWRRIGREIEDIKSVTLWRGAFAEFVGCTLLCMFTIGMALRREDQDPVPLFEVAVGVGFFLAAIITTLSQVSGAHVNPAISVGFLLTRQITFVRFIIFSIFQTCGGIAGTGLLKMIVPTEYEGQLGLLTPGKGVTPSEAFAMETLITFFLLFGTMAIVDPGRNDIGGSVPMICGFMVTVNILVAGTISGGCMNPIRNFGPAMILGEFDTIWIYWAGPMLGAVLGTVVYDWFFSTEPLKCEKFCTKKENTGMYELKKTKSKDNFRQSLLNTTLDGLDNLDNSPESKV